jgi:hypothetical protein
LASPARPPEYSGLQSRAGLADFPLAPPARFCPVGRRTPRVTVLRSLDYRAPLPGYRAPARRVTCPAPGGPAGYPAPPSAPGPVNFRTTRLVATEYEPALVAVGTGAFACGVQGTPSPLPGVGWDEGPPAGELFT